MDAPTTAPHNWTEMVSYLLASFLAASGWFTAWRNRRKPDADIDLSQSEAQKNRAEAKKIEAEVTKTYNDVIREINKDLRDAEGERLLLKQERDRAIEEKCAAEEKMIDLIRSTEAKDAEIQELRREVERRKGNGLYRHDSNSSDN